MTRYHTLLATRDRLRARVKANAGHPGVERLRQRLVDLNHAILGMELRNE